MAYTTAFGRVVEYPFALAANAVRAGRDDVNQIVHDTHAIFSALQTADAAVITLRLENQRLKHENEFMLRLINDRDA